MEKRTTVKSGGETHIVYKNKETGEIMVTHPGQDKGKWDTIDLTDKSKAKTVEQGVKAVNKWHKNNPYKQDGMASSETIKKMFHK